MPAPRLSVSRRNDARAEYYYRRQLGLRELIPAVGVAIGAGLFAFYITRLLLQRTPLRVDRGPGLAPKDGVAARSARVRSDNPAA
jgi:hypothetical protein